MTFRVILQLCKTEGYTESNKKIIAYREEICIPLLLKQEILLVLFIKSVNCKENKTTSSLLDFST